jgi:hypothetical protein
MGLDPNTVSSALLKLYIAGGKIPFRRGSEEPVILPYWDQPQWVIKVFYRYKLIEHTAHGSRENRTYYYRLTEKGWKIAQDIIQDFIEIKRGEIRRGLQDFSPKLLSLAVIGCSGRVGLTYKTIGMKKASLEELSNLLRTIELNVAISEFDEAILDVVTKTGFKEAAEQIKDRELSIICKNYMIVFSRFMVEYPLVRQRVEQLFEALVSKGVAIKLPEYGSKGQYLCEVYKTPLEIGYEILSMSEPDLTKELERFIEISVFLRALWRDFTKGRLETFLKAFGLSEFVIDSMLNIMATEGVTSKYNKLGDDESLPFIILDEENYFKHIDQALKILANHILASGVN